MNKVLLVGFLLAIATQSLGQGIVVQNSNPTSSIANRGSYIADSIFRIGTRDTVKPSWWNPAWSFNGALQIGLDGKPYYYYGGYWRGVGSGASVTSITQGYGMALSPSPIVSTGSVSVDTTAISTKANVNSLLSAKLNISDTNSMLGGYLRKVDTSTLSTRIDARVKYVDTAAMLAPYATDAQVALKLNIADTANMRIRPIAGSNMTISGTYPNVTFASTTIPTDSTIFATNYRVDTAKANLRTSINTKLNSADTASLSNRIDARVKYTDTASMLSSYLSSAAASTTYVPYTGATTNVNLGTHTLSSYDLVVNHTSGSGVAASITKGGSGEALTVVKSSGSGNAASITGGVTLLDELHLNTDLADAYIASAATWNAKIGAGDTAAMLGGYLRKVDTASLSTRINTKLNSADTASLSTRIDARVKYSDTSTMLGGYLRKVDTASLSNRIDAKVGYGTLTTNYVPKATSTTAIGNSQIFDNGTSVGIGTATPNAAFKLDVNGKGRFQTSCLISSTVDYGWPFQVNNQDFRILSDGQFGRHTGLNFNTVNWNLAGVRSQVQLGTAGSAYENQLVIICQEGPVRINPYGTNYTNRSVIIGNTTARTEKLQVDGTSYFSGSTLVGTGTANASALLEVNSTTQGLGLPSMTTTQQNAIGTPRAGLAVYNSTLAAPTYYNGTAWTTFGGASGWGLTGNAGTSAATNFIGTTDDIDLMFRRNNISSGRISTNNTAFGNGAGAALTSGANNSLFGAGAGGKLTNPSQNTYFGFNAGSEVVSGFNNIYIGSQAGASAGHTSGNKNLVISHQGMVATNNGANQLNIGNVLWGVDCSATGTTAAGRLGVGTNAPNASALLDLTSTTQGFLPPRMTATQAAAIAAPAEGLMVYVTNTGGVFTGKGWWGWNGAAWEKLNP
jgi:hypothetical protein